MPHHPHPAREALGLWYALALCLACIVATAALGYSLTSCMAGQP